jgi:hypothetical protein
MNISEIKSGIRLHFTFEKIKKGFPQEGKAFNVERVT